MQPLDIVQGFALVSQPSLVPKGAGSRARLVGSSSFPRLVLPYLRPGAPDEYPKGAWNVENPICFELTDLELQQLHQVWWGGGSDDLICQAIVRDYLRRMNAKAARRAGKIDRADQAQSARRAGL